MVANNPLFKDACQALQRAPAGYKPSNREGLRNALLEAEHLQVEQDVSEKRKAIDKLGCTMISDGWKDHSKIPILNFIVANKDYAVFFGALNSQGLLLSLYIAVNSLCIINSP